MDISARIENLKIDPAILNASGILSYAPVLKAISEFQIGALVTKSTCYDGKEGFENPILAKCSAEAWINAVGLPNSGCASKRKELKEVYPHFKSIKKPLIVSLFESNSEKLRAAIILLDDFCDAFELNFSCPNLMPGEKTGMVIGRDPDLVKQYTKTANEATKKPIIIKLSPGPYLDDKERIKEIALSAATAGASAISAINTVPSGMKIDIFAKKPVLDAKYGGLSGRAIKPIGMGCVYTIYEELQSNGYNIPIIGIGGIETAEDIIEYIEAGASAVAIGPALVGKRLEHLKNYFSDLVLNLEILLGSLEVNSLKEIRGIAHE